MRPLMVLGCTSDAGKSLVAAALCRWFARQGVRVAPFKAQNMSNNARVVTALAGDGSAGEIGVAQWLQARAARVEPDVRMNPVLLKPEADTQSQVVVRGRVDRRLSAVPWELRHDVLWEPMASSLDELRADFDLVVIEGAGSPAEINLRDQVNNRMVEYADARALLVSDIDRGGSFAHLYGTWALVPDPTRQRLEGFVLNKFRGDARLLAPGPELLSERTGMTHLATLPMLAHDLPREEGGIEDRHGGFGVDEHAPRVVIARFPFGSNLDEFRLLARSVNVVWAASPAAFDGLDPRRDLVVLPGSKHVRADLEWMRAAGIDVAVTRAAGAGVRVMGICGGAMMLGRRIVDTPGVEGGHAGAGAAGLGLLPYSTTMGATKLVRRGTPVLTGLDGRWRSLDGRSAEGYEIRYGVMAAQDAANAAAPTERTVWSEGSVCATTWHGLFEDPGLVRAVLGVDVVDPLDATFDLLADAVEEHVDAAWLRSFLA